MRDTRVFALCLVHISFLFHYFLHIVRVGDGKTMTTNNPGGRFTIHYGTAPPTLIPSCHST